MFIIEGLIATDQNRDFACSGLVNTAGYRCLEAGNSIVRGQGRQAFYLFEIIGAHVDPGAAGLEACQNAILPGHDCGDSRWRGKAGDDGVC